MGMDPVTMAAVGSLLAGGASAFTALTAKKPDAPAAPSAPEAAPASAKTPDRMATKKKTTDAVSAGAPGSTLLTGPAGVQLDASILGKNTLLGG
jgi:hypothetical protein